MCQRWREGSWSLSSFQKFHPLWQVVVTFKNFHSAAVARWKAASCKERHCRELRLWKTGFAICQCPDVCSYHLPAGQRTNTRRGASIRIRRPPSGVKRFTMSELLWLKNSLPNWWGRNRSQVEMKSCHAFIFYTCWLFTGPCAEDIFSVSY